MTFTIEWHPQARKNLKKCPKHLIERILKRFDLLFEEPFKYLEHYEGEAVYKFRIGNYRALVDVNVKENVLFVQQFDHRSRIYKR